MSTLNFLYETKLGRVLLRPLISKPISDFSGFLLDSKISKALIRSFAKNNNTASYGLQRIKGTT